MATEINPEQKMDGGEESQSDVNTVTIPNRLAEFMLVVGIDDNTGLVPLNKKDFDMSDEDIFTDLHFQNYQAHVLAAVTARKALYFQPYLKEDPNYPPYYNIGKPGFRFHQANRNATETQSQGRGPKNNPYGGGRALSVSPAVITHHLKKLEPGEMSAFVKGADLPISEDVIRSITTFCFPDNVNVYKDRPDDIIHFLVLTDLSGNKTYATCITFYKKYIIEKGSKGSLVYTLAEKDSHKNSQEQHLCFFPQCCVVVSKYPYFYVMKEILSCMIGHVERDMEEMYSFVKDFTYTMTMCPVPPAGNVIVEMSVSNLSVMLYPAESPEKPVNDLPLHLVFLCFHADDVLRIFSAVLMEQRIVFVSSNYALLTTIMESFLYFILPFHWPFTYVPILSASSLELLEAPGTFMMGCHTRHLEVVEQIDGLVVVNVDEGTLSVSTLTSQVERRSSIVNVLDRDLIPDLPNECANHFKKICKRIKFQLELLDVQRPFYYDINQERMFRMKKCLQFNTEISFAFLELMVNLFRTVPNILKIEVRQFNKQTFLESIDTDDRPFYEKVLATEMFKMFIEDRLNEKEDYWSEYERKTRPWAKKASFDTPVPSRIRKPLQKQVSVTTFSASMTYRDFQILRLPTLNSPEKYVRDSISQLNDKLKTCRDPQLKANYLYLRGVFCAASGKTMEALEDLLSIQSANSRLLPVRLCRDLLATISEPEKQEEILHRRGVNHIQELIQGNNPAPGRRGFIDKVKIPQTDLCLEEFVELMSQLEMATDYDITQRIFQALCHPNKPGYVDNYTFQVFHLAYEENEKQCNTIAVPDGFLKSDECILRVSPLIKTDFGNGRLALTDKRILFLKDGTNCVKEVTRLRNIEKLEGVVYHSFLNSVETLVLVDSSNKKFTAFLKDDCYSWLVLINEMKSGKIVAEATKDFSASSQASQNVLLLDAIIRSARDENTAHHKIVVQDVPNLCYFSDYVKGKKHELPKDTSQALQHRVDPNFGQRERKTVEVLLYVPGCDVSESSEGSISPRLWCGMGDGKVRIFDATNWTLEKTFVQTKGNVACLVAVGDTQVWAGAQGIFIIESQTIMCNKILTEHQDMVSDIFITENGRYAYSSSVDGSLIKWEVQTLTPVRRFKLNQNASGQGCFIRSLQFHENNLWCGTWENIIVVDCEGNPLQIFQYCSEIGFRTEQLDCFLIVNQELWAGCRRRGMIVVWDIKSTQVKTTHNLDCRGVSIMKHIGDKVWVGTKEGKIFIYKDSGKLWKIIKAHEDAVRALCAAEERYVMSGAGSKDGKVAIWSPLGSGWDFNNSQPLDE